MTERIRRPAAAKCRVTLCLAILFSGLLGCAGSGRASRPAEGVDVAVSVQPVRNTSALRLTADDVIAILRQLGHTDQHIFEVGEDLRDALLNYGGAKIRIGDQTDAALKVQGFHVWIQSLRRGTFVYDVKSHEFILGPGVNSLSSAQP